jgi:hypothetical protein
LVDQGAKLFESFRLDIKLLLFFSGLLLRSIFNLLVILLDPGHRFFDVGLFPALEVSLRFKPNNLTVTVDFVNDEIRKPVLNCAIK